MEDCKQCGDSHAAAKEVVLKETVEDSGKKFDIDFTVKSDEALCVKCAVQLMYKGLAKLEQDYSCAAMIIEGKNE